MDAKVVDAALEALKKATDWTIEEIKKIGWMQVIAVGTSWFWLLSSAWWSRFLPLGRVQFRTPLRLRFF